MNDKILLIKKFVKEVQDSGIKVRNLKSRKLIVFSGIQKEKSYIYVRCIDPYDDFKNYLEGLENISLHYVVSFPYCLTEEIHDLLHLKYNSKKDDNGIIYIDDRGVENIRKDIIDICQEIGIDYLIEYPLF